MTKNRMKTALDNIKVGYIVFYITYLMLSRIVPFVNVISQAVNSAMYSLIAIVGALICAVCFFVDFKGKPSFGKVLLFLFLVVCGISSALNYEYGIVNNLKTLVWTAIHFFVIFAFFDTTDRKKIRLALDLIMKISSAVWFAAVAVSLVQFVLKIEYQAEFSDYMRRQGFTEGRLFGVFSDPNFAAVTSLIVILLCFYLIRKSDNIILKAFYWLNIAFQILYVILSGSRTGLVSGVVLVMTLILFMARNNRIIRKNNAVLLKSLVVIVVGVGLVSMMGIVGDNVAVASPEETASESISIFGRDDVSLDNISNNRFEIWKSALELFKDKKIFGLSPRNMVTYAEEMHPDSYIAKTGYEAHCGYIALIVGSGILGAIIIAAFIIYVMIKIFLFIKRKKGSVLSDEFVFSFTLALVISVSAVFMLDIFFVNMFSTVFFWLSVGYMLNEIEKKDETIQ